MTVRKVFPIIDARELKTLTARICSEGVGVPDPSKDEDGWDDVLKHRWFSRGYRVVRLQRRQAALYARAKLEEAATKLGTIAVTRAFDVPKLSGYSFDRVYRAELHNERQRRAALQRELADGCSRKRRGEIARELANRAKQTAFAATVRIGREAFDAAQSARNRKRRVSVA